MMRALVTGGGGFIGHHLVAALLDRGGDVRVVDDFSTGSRARLERFGRRVEVLEGSILDERLLAEAARSCDVIFHEAAIPSVARSVEAPLPSNEVNVTGTIQVMVTAAEQGVRRVVLAGSSSVYGTPETLPCRETMRPNPESPYGVSKLAAELYLHTLGESLGVETVSLRYFNVFGPGQDPHSEYAAVVPNFVTAVLDGRRPTINGTGEISRDFTYIDNVVSANLLAADAPASGGTYNIACGGRTTLTGLLAAIGEAAGVAVEPIIGPPRSGDIQHSLADISAARVDLGYDVSVPFEEGVARTVAWFAGQRALGETPSAR